MTYPGVVYSLSSRAYPRPIYLFLQRGVNVLLADSVSSSSPSSSGLSRSAAISQVTETILSDVNVIAVLRARRDQLKLRESGVTSSNAKTVNFSRVSLEIDSSVAGQHDRVRTKTKKSLQSPKVNLPMSPMKRSPAHDRVGFGETNRASAVDMDDNNSSNDDTDENENDDNGAAASVTTPATSASSPLSTAINTATTATSTSADSSTMTPPTRTSTAATNTRSPSMATISTNTAALPRMSSAGTTTNGGDGLAGNDNDSDSDGDDFQMNRFQVSVSKLR